jgi:hypothetical protein
MTFRVTPSLILATSLLVSMTGCRLDTSGLSGGLRGAAVAGDGGAGGTAAHGGSGGGGGTPMPTTGDGGGEGGGGGAGGAGGTGGMVADAGLPDAENPTEAGMPPHPCANGQGACPAAMFCDRDLGVCGGGGVCVLIQRACSNVVARVCGCDGVTYLNDCLRIRAGVSKQADGGC